MMTPRRSNSRPDSGFVLLEALVSLTLLAMTVALVATTLSFGRRIADAGRARERIADAMTGVHVIADWLGRTLPAREAGAGGNMRVLFDGNPTQLTFRTLSNGDTQPGGVLAISVAFTRPGQALSGALVFTSKSVAAGTLDLAGGRAEPQVLVGHVIEARFRYFGSPAESEPPTWRENWTDAARLPTHVALRLQLSVGSRVEAMDLTFRVMAE
jgi:Tfp pilus assembly protein PilV